VTQLKQVADVELENTKCTDTIVNGAVQAIPADTMGNIKKKKKKKEIPPNATNYPKYTHGNEVLVGRTRNPVFTAITNTM
jgi:hypothetical protein